MAYGVEGDSSRTFEFVSKGLWKIIFALLFIGATFIILVYLFDGAGFTWEQVFNSPPQSFSDVWDEDFGFLDYIFGTIPGQLFDALGPTSSSIIVIGIWLLFLLAFGDILSLFSIFSKGISWVTAVILVIMVSNLKLVQIVSALFLGFAAIFGAFSVVASIVMVFVLFIAFHFGTSEVRRYIILRRAEDSAIRAVAGGKKAASGIEVLKDIADSAKRQS